MVNDLVELFRKGIQTHGDRIILDIYKPKEGLYLRVSQEGKVVSKLVIDKNVDRDSEEYKWFRDRDYYSCLVDMNKPVDPKKQIHSNNYFSVFVKKDVFPVVGQEPKVLSKEAFSELLKNYFHLLYLPEEKYKKDKKTFELMQALDTQPLDSAPVFEDFMLNRLEYLIEEIQNESFQNYIKVFFDQELAVYEKEGNKYLIPKIFNDNAYNQKVGGGILGLSNNNMGMNAKKPYLEHKTTKYKVPYRVDIESALLGKKLFDWLNYQDSMEIIIPYKHDFSTSLPSRSNVKGGCFYVHTTRGASVTIDEFDFISSFDMEINFNYENYLGVDGAKDDVCDSTERLEKVVDEYFFNKSLKNSYYRKPSEIRIMGLKNTEGLKNILIMSRKAFHSFFRKTQREEIRSQIDKVSGQIVKELLMNVESLYFLKVVNAFNLRMSLLKYFETGGWKMGDKISALKEKLKQKIENDGENACCNDQDEFYFAAGQLVRFLLSKSAAQRKTYSMLEPFFRAKTGKDLKNEVTRILEAYKHAVSMPDKRFGSCMRMVQGYSEPSLVKDYEDIFLGGFLCESVIFAEKKEAKQ